MSPGAARYHARLQTPPKPLRPCSECRRPISRTPASKTCDPRCSKLRAQRTRRERECVR